MGDAKRRKQVAAAEERLWQALELNSVCPGPVPRKDSVQALVVSLERQDEARRVLGDLPALCNEFLIEAARLQSTGADDAPDAVCWERWPSGRQVAHMVKGLDGVQAAYPAVVHFHAGVRGYGVLLAAFPSQGWAEAVQSVQSDYVRHTEEVVALMNAAPRILHTYPQLHYSEITIPRIDNDGMRAGMVAQTLRILDSLVANKESLLQNFGCLRLYFEGYDNDPREVWEIEQNAQFLRRLAMHAPWWPWLVAPEQVIIWLGAQIAEGSRVVAKAGLVAVSLNDEAAKALLGECLSACIEVIGSVGMDPASDEFQSKLMSVMQYLSGGLPSTSQAYKELQSEAAEADGEFEVTRAPEGEREEMGAYRDLRLQCVIALDRSERGRTALEALDSRLLPFLPESVRVELRGWSQTTEPLALVRGFPDDESSWIVDASGTGNEQLSVLVESVAATASEAKAPMAWLLAVSDPLAEKLSGLASAASEKLGLPSSLSPLGPDTLSHKGLLNLAIEPGGQEVDFDSVQIFDSDVFGKVLQLTMGCFAEKLSQMQNSNKEADIEAFKLSALRAWKREDGSLLIRETGGPMREVVAPSGTWRLLDTAQLRKLSQEAEYRTSEAPEVFEWMASAVTESIASNRRREESFEKVAESVTSIVGLFGRGTRSLSALREMIGNKPDATDTADRWLQSDQKYFLFWRAKDGRAAAVVVGDEEVLFSGALDSALELGDAPQATILVACTDTSIDAEARIWWERHGGLLIKQRLRDISEASHH
jgi:hypothetical protein